jgi:hypothetical protein
MAALARHVIRHRQLVDGGSRAAKPAISNLEDHVLAAVQSDPGSET